MPRYAYGRFSASRRTTRTRYGSYTTGERPLTTFNESVKPTPATVAGLNWAPLPDRFVSHETLTQEERNHINMLGDVRGNEYTLVFNNTVAFSTAYIPQLDPCYWHAQREDQSCKDYNSAEDRKRWSIRSEREQEQADPKFGLPYQLSMRGICQVEIGQYATRDEARMAAVKTIEKFAMQCERRRLSVIHNIDANIDANTEGK